LISLEFSEFTSSLHFSIMVLRLERKEDYDSQVYEIGTTEGGV